MIKEYCDNCSEEITATNINVAKNGLNVLLEDFSFDVKIKSKHTNIKNCLCLNCFKKMIAEIQEPSIIQQPDYAPNPPNINPPNINPFPNTFPNYPNYLNYPYWPKEIPEYPYGPFRPKRKYYILQ